MSDFWTSGFWADGFWASSFWTEASDTAELGIDELINITDIN